MSKIGLGALAAFTALLPANAMAASDASSGFGISLSIPVVCDLDAQDFVLDATQNRISGNVREFCNSSRGFQIMASHRPLYDGETVGLTYDGASAHLNSAGISTIAFRNGARFRSVPVQIEASGLETLLAVSFSIMAI